MKFNLILSCFVAILALVNPIQKVLIVTSLQERFSPTELRYISIKSTITAMLILIFFLYLGIFSKCPYKIQWHMKMPQYNHFICHFYCHFSVFSHILL